MKNQLVYPTKSKFSILFLSLLILFIFAIYSFTNSNADIATASEKMNASFELICPTDVSILCNQDPKLRDESGLLLTGEATLIDGQNGETVTYTDSTVYFAPCDFPRTVIYRIWKVIDTDSNELGNCIQVISVDPWDIKKLEFPEDVLLYDLTDCEEIKDQMDLIHPDQTGVPTLDGLPIFDNGAQCLINVLVSDEYYYNCPESVEVVRTWKVENQCAPPSIANPVVHQQRIKLLNEPGPEMIDCPEDITINVDPWGCSASPELYVPSNIQDTCGGVNFFAETFEGGILQVTGSVADDNLSVFAVGLEPGLHHFKYTINDSCGNVYICEFEITVREPSPNLFIDNNFVVKLTTTGTAGDAKSTLTVSDLDNGSNDPCRLSKLEIRRDIDLCDIPGNATYNDDGHANDGDSDPNSPNYDPDGGQSVEFCCADLSSALIDVNGDGELDLGYAKVWLRMWVDTNDDNIPGNEGDNYYETWTFVKVEDQLAPAIVCPADVTVQCTDDLLNPDIIGVALGYSTCGSVPTEFNDIITNINACGEGFVRKRWYVVGRSDIFCDQTVTISGVDVSTEFDPEQEVFFDHCPDPTEVPLPEVPTNGCHDIDYNFSADTSYFEGGFCYQVQRNYEIIDWCLYTPNDPTWEETADFSDGLAQVTQTINVSDQDKAIIEKCDDFIVAINDLDDEDNDGNVCEAKIVLTNSALDPDGGFCMDGWLKWLVFVDLYADGTNDLEFSSFLPPFDDVFDDTNGNGVADIYLEPTVSGEEFSVQLPDIEGGFSLHKLYWKVTDGCNNVTTCNLEFQVLDQTPPESICQDTSMVDISQIGPTTIWAIDYVVGAADNCSEEEELSYTFSNTPPDNDPAFDPDLKSSSKIINLNDINNSPITLSIYTWDQKLNAAICETVLIINTAVISEGEGVLEIAQDEEIRSYIFDPFDEGVMMGVDANVLHQNRPNPFRNGTTIQFDLAQDSPVKLSFIHVTNGGVYDVEIDGRKGENIFRLESQMLSGQGVYYYRIMVGGYVESKRMVMLE